MAGGRHRSPSPSPPRRQPQRSLPVLAPRAKGIGHSRQGSRATPSFGARSKHVVVRSGSSVPELLGRPLRASSVSASLAGPQRLCLSCWPGEGEVSPSQPSSPLALPAASSGVPPLWWLEMVQSGAVGVLVAHEQMPRQPLVPCSGEALEPQSQQGARGRQGAWVPYKSWPTPSARRGEPAPHPERRTPGSSVDVGWLWCSDPDPVWPALLDGFPSVARVPGPLLLVTAPNALTEGGPRGSDQLPLGGVLAPMLAGSGACAERPVGVQASFLVLPAREQGCSAHPRSPEAGLSCR